MRPSSVNADDMLDLNNLEEPKTIKFVNGFPPKKLKAKRVVEKEGKGVTFELMQLVGCSLLILIICLFHPLCCMFFFFGFQRNRHQLSAEVRN